MLTAKIGINQSDQAVWPVCCCSWSGRSPIGLTGGSDRSSRSPTVIRVLNRFKSVNMNSCVVSLSHPIIYKGSRPIEDTTQSNLSKTHLLSLYLYPTFPTSTCCSSLVSMAFEDALAGLPSLGQPYTRLPRRGPSRASVRRIVAVLHGDRSDRSLWPGWPLHAGGVARSSSSHRAT